MLNEAPLSALNSSLYFSRIVNPSRGWARTATSLLHIASARAGVAITPDIRHAAAPKVAANLFVLVMGVPLCTCYVSGLPLGKSGSKSRRGRGWPNSGALATIRYEFARDI